MGNPRRSLKKYEISNLLFFLFLIVALGTLVTFVFRSYGTKNRIPAGEVETGIISEDVYEDICSFYLGTRVSETTRQYRGRIEIPFTDDGLIRGLFDLPGVEEITINPTTIMLKKNGTVAWNEIRGKAREIILNHLHSHY